MDYRVAHLSPCPLGRAGTLEECDRTFDTDSAAKLWEKNQKWICEGLSAQCLTGARGRWSGGEEAAVVWVGVGVLQPQGCGCSLLTLPQLQQCLEKVLLTQPEPSFCKGFMILVTQMALRSSWYCKQVHSRSVYPENLTAARCLTR